MKTQSKLAHVTNVMPISKLKLKTDVIFKIEGKLSDTGWQFSDDKIAIDEDSNTISITLTIFKQPGKAGMDVITKFSREVKIKFPYKGAWKVHCNNYEIDVEIK